MINTTPVKARDIMRDYKHVIDSVKQTKRPAVIYSRKEPQVAIISLDDLENLQRLQSRNSAIELLEFTQKARALLAKEKLPTSLATHHDKHIWDE